MKDPIDHSLATSPVKGRSGYILYARSLYNRMHFKIQKVGGEPLAK